MTFVNAGTLGTLDGHRDELVATLIKRSNVLRELGCRLYEVGVSENAPDTVFVVEVWDSADAHRRSLEHPQVQAAIATARPILSGEFGGFQFNVVGSPLRDD
ncbi:MAG: putative quinol monooxygenase [Jatrophihabitans sp.]